MAFSVSTISPEQQAAYQQGRGNARRSLLTSRAQTQYERGLAKQAYGNQLQDFGVQQGRIREQLPTSYIQRGVFNSGIYRDALKNYAIDRLSGERDLSQSYQQRLNELGLRDRQSEDEYATALSNLYLSQLGAQQQLASALRGIQ